jgi:hypothetical protein
MKKFNDYINENKQSGGIPSVAFELTLDNKIYYIIANANDPQMQITFTEDGKLINNFTEDDIDESSEAFIKPLKNIPENILKSLKNMGAVKGFSKQTEPSQETEQKIDEPTDKDNLYSEMGQKELNYQLNIALDNEDWEKAKEISEYLKESLVDKMTDIQDEELNEIIKLLKENGYVYRGVNIEDEGNWHKNKRDKDVLWYVYGDDDYKKRTPKTHYLSVTLDSKLPEVKERIELYKKRYNL